MGASAAEKEQQKQQKRTMKIMKYLRFNIPNKKTMIKKQEYDYFTAFEAIECLMKSSYFTKDGDKVPRSDRKQGEFYTRDCVVKFFKYAVYNRMACRAFKKYKDDNAVEEKKSKENKESEDEPKKKKRKYKIQVHPHQGFFDDSEEVYIWFYNPTPLKHWVYGFGVMLVVIGGTLFPLWPSTLRTGVYYSSISLAGFIGGVLVVGLLRTIFFGILWALSGGKHNFWFLPNLLADVGFFESFQPVYTYEYVAPKDKSIKNDDNAGPENNELADSVEEVETEEKKDK